MDHEGEGEGKGWIGGKGEGGQGEKKTIRGWKGGEKQTRI